MAMQNAKLSGLCCGNYLFNIGTAHGQTKWKQKDILKFIKEIKPLLTSSISFTFTNSTQKVERKFLKQLGFTEQLIPKNPDIKVSRSGSNTMILHSGSTSTILKNCNILINQNRDRVRFKKPVSYKEYLKNMDYPEWSRATGIYSGAGSSFTSKDPYLKRNYKNILVRHGMIKSSDRIPWSSISTFQNLFEYSKAKINGTKPKFTKTYTDHRMSYETWETKTSCGAGANYQLFDGFSSIRNLEEAERYINTIKNSIGVDININITTCRTNHDLYLLTIEALREKNKGKKSKSKSRARRSTGRLKSSKNSGMTLDEFQALVEAAVERDGLRRVDWTVAWFAPGGQLADGIRAAFDFPVGWELTPPGVRAFQCTLRQAYEFTSFEIERLERSE